MRNFIKDMNLGRNISMGDKPAWLKRDRVGKTTHYDHIHSEMTRFVIKKK